MAKKKTSVKSSKKASKKTSKKVSVKKKSDKKIITKSVDKLEFDVGKLSFIFGIFLSLLVGIILGTGNFKLSLGVGIAYSIIFILGLIVGLLNITVKEINEFLIASITFLVAAGLNVYVIKLTLPVFGGLIEQVFFAMGIFVAPAATIVALKAMYELAKKR